MEAPVEWLLGGPPWVKYRTRLDLLGQREDDAEVKSARAEMLSHPLVQGLLQVLGEWPWPALTSHKSARHPIHLLSFAADIGINQNDPGIPKIIDHILENRTPNGLVQVRVKTYVHFGGSGQEQWAWFLCDAPLMLACLARMGLRDDERVRLGVEYLAGLVRQNGWPCAVSKEMGSFRGPGRKEDPCPYANLLMLKLLAEISELQDSPSARLGAQSLLNLWQDRREKHPYLFHMGTDFCKLKAPLVWYDLLHVCDVLTRFKWLQHDPRLLQMMALLRQKKDDQGRYVPESVWTAWKGWDFGQKREPSPWLTFLIGRILMRMDGKVL